MKRTVNAFLVDGIFSPTVVSANPELANTPWAHKANARRRARVNMIFHSFLHFVFPCFGSLLATKNDNGIGNREPL
jgi:hypothetical protein